MNNNNFVANDPDDNIFNDVSDIFNCRYTGIDKFIEAQKQFSLKGLSVICFNIRSFSCNGDEFLGYLHNTKHSFDLIILTETWNKEYSCVLCNIPGYSAVHNFRPDKKSGGVSIFIRADIKYDELGHLNITHELIESAAVRIYYPNSDKVINVLGIYRPPNGNANDFIEKLNDIINQN